MLQGGGGNLGKQGDRVTLDLPDVQKELLEKLFKLNKKVIILNFSGGCIDLRAYKNKADAILQCWYPGAMGGKAIANILFGKCSPSGKLPVTFYNSISDLPEFTDYSMKNRTYRYYDGDVQYPFGYGLSYTDFSLENYKLSSNKLYCTVKNTGSEITGLSTKTAIVRGAGDNAAAAVGTGVVENGKAFTTIGTSGVVYVHTDKPLLDEKGRIHTFCCAVPNAWHVMGVTQGAGLSLQWFKNQFCTEEAEKAKENNC